MKKVLIILSVSFLVLAANNVCSQNTTEMVSVTFLSKLNNIFVEDINIEKMSPLGFSFNEESGNVISLQYPVGEKHRFSILGETFTLDMHNDTYVSIFYNKIKIVSKGMQKTIKLKDSIMQAVPFISGFEARSLTKLKLKDDRVEAAKNKVITICNYNSIFAIRIYGGDAYTKSTILMLEKFFRELKQTPLNLSYEPERIVYDYCVREIHGQKHLVIKTLFEKPLVTQSN